MNWNVAFLEEASKDLRDLTQEQRKQVRKMIDRVSQSPDVDGYGKPLGNVGGRNLTSCFKIKLRAAGLRVVYKLIRTDTKMLVVVVGVREDDEVYEEAAKRIWKHGL